MKKDKNGIPYNLEVPIYYNVQDGSYILEMDTMIDDFNDKLKSLDSLCVKLKKEKNKIFSWDRRFRSKRLRRRR